MELFNSQPLVAIGIIFVGGYLGGLLANWLKFPKVTGYIIAGMVLSPSISGIIPAELIQDKLSIVTDIALAIIAYSIGGSLKLSQLRFLGKNIFLITIIQALGAFFFTFILIACLSPLLLTFDLPNNSYIEIYLPLALIIGAVSIATAPAAVLAIVHECKAQGPFTTTLLGVVALDDGIAIIFYAFAISVIKSITQSTGNSIINICYEPAIIIAGSIILGTIVGFLLTNLARWVKNKKSLLVVILGNILFCAGIAIQLDLSPLLTNMMVGFFVVNMAKHSHDLFLAVDNIEEIIFVLFFTLAGAHFDLTIVRIAGPIAILIVIGRFIGKLFGTKLGARLSHAPVAVRKYLGYGLLPTAGVTVGLILMVQPHMRLPVVSDIMINAVLASVIINELIAPPMVKYALVKSGEAG